MNEAANLNKRPVTIIIPAYKPNNSMISFLYKLSQEGFEKILLIDDGSGSEFDFIFRKAQQIIGVELIRHAINMGKGRSLKTAINYYLTSAPNTSIGVVTADADGQHLSTDIVRIAEKLLSVQDTLVLGSRDLSKDVPIKSRLGNAITRMVYRFASGIKLMDTQTGLRGIPRAYLRKVLSLNGERYEYEMSMLLDLKSLGLKVIEVPIKTVYIDDNNGSHFKAFSDSWKIYKLIISFVGSSLFAAVIDIMLYTYFFYLVFPGNLLAAVVLARLVSSFTNFLINRQVMLPKHEGNQKVWLHGVKYYILAVFIMSASYGLTYLLSVPLGLNPVLAKVMSDGFLFIASFIVQKQIVFK